MQTRFLPKKYVKQSVENCIEIYKYLQEHYNINVKYEIFNSIYESMNESISQEDAEWYFQRLHNVQRVHRKHYGPETDFYKFFPHLIEFAEEYGIKRQ